MTGTWPDDVPKPMRNDDNQHLRIKYKNFEERYVADARFRENCHHWGAVTPELRLQMQKNARIHEHAERMQQMNLSDREWHEMMSQPSTVSIPWSARATGSFTRDPPSWTPDPPVDSPCDEAMPVDSAFQARTDWSGYQRITPVAPPMVPDTASSSLPEMPEPVSQSASASYTHVVEEPPPAETVDIGALSEASPSATGDESESSLPSEISSPPSASDAVSPITPPVVAAPISAPPSN